MSLLHILGLWRVVEKRDGICIYTVSIRGYWNVIYLQVYGGHQTTNRYPLATITGEIAQTVEPVSLSVEGKTPCTDHCCLAFLTALSAGRSIPIPVDLLCCELSEYSTHLRYTDPTRNVTAVVKYVFIDNM